MSIRSGAKAIIVKDGCVLLNRCRHEDGSVYYDLPGGGQHPYESLEDAVRREVMEESEWVPVEQIQLLPEVCPKGLQQMMTQILEQQAPVYLGTHYLTWTQA